MNLRKNFAELSFKDKIDMIEDILTIILSACALWGSLIAWRNGFWHNIKHIAEHYHNEIVKVEDKKI